MSKYAAVVLIAVIAIPAPLSGKVDMISFYTDSERLGVRNTHAPEQSQDRIGGTLWEFPSATSSTRRSSGLIASKRRF